MSGTENLRVTRRNSRDEMTPEEIENRRAKRREWQRLYRAAHADVIKAAARRWRRAHPEKIREERKRYKALHPDKVEQWRCAYDARWPDRARDSLKRAHQKQTAKRRELAAIKHLKDAALQAFNEGPSLSGNKLFQRIDAAVTRNLPQFVRDDVISEITLAVLEGVLPVDQIERQAGKFLRAHNRMFDQFGTVSLDEEIPGTDGLTYGDRLTYEEEPADE